MRAALLALGLTALAGVAVAQTALPALLSTAIAETVARAAPHSYEVTVESERGTLRYAFDPSASGAARIRLISPAETALDSRQRQSLERIRRDADGDIWCASAKMRTANNVTVVSEDADSITYSFTPSPDQAGGQRSAGLVRHLRGEARVLKESRDVASIRISAPQPFHASVARIDRFNLSIRCEAAANGRRYAAETTSQFVGSVLGSNINERSVQRITNLRPR